MTIQNDSISAEIDSTEETASAMRVINLSDLHLGSTVLMQYQDSTFDCRVRASKQVKSPNPDLTSILQALSGKFKPAYINVDENAVLQLDEASAGYIAVSDDDVYVHVSTHADMDHAQALLDEILSVLPKRDNDGKVPFKIWTQRNGFATDTYKRMAIPDWDTVSINYPVDVRDQLDKLINRTDSDTGGRLIVFHGAPGTGKSHAIRTMAKTWAAWASVEFIADPSVFLGDPSYMMSVIETDAEDNHDYIGHEFLVPSKRVRKDTDTRTARLLILEDYGTILSKDAAIDMEQSMSSLLNLTSGILGASYNIYVLITTNTERSERNEAMFRDGRLLCEIEFTELPIAEVKTWASAHGVTVDSRPYTLAELYKLLDSSDGTIKKSKQKRAFGF